MRCEEKDLQEEALNMAGYVVSYALDIATESNVPISAWCQMMS